MKLLIEKLIYLLNLEVVYNSLKKSGDGFIK